MHGATIKAMSV